MACLKALLFLCVTFEVTQARGLNELSKFINDFLQYEERPSTVVSHLSLTKKEHVQVCKYFSEKHKQFKVASTVSETNGENVVYLADCRREDTWELLHQAIKDNTIKSPSRWLLLHDDVVGNDINSTNMYEYRSDIEKRLGHLYLDMSTEVFIAIRQQNQVELFSVYKIKPHLPLIWEELGVWSKGFDRQRPPPVAVRRRNVRGEPVVASTVILDNRTSMAHMNDYLHREIDTLSKLVYYMTRHVTEWVNGTVVVNRTRSWGYRQPDGRHDGVVREMREGRADLSGSVMIPTTDRLKYVNYVLSPAPIQAVFIFKKPPLASVTNIYILPFSIGVWMFLVILTVVSSLTLFMAYCSDGHTQLKVAFGACRNFLLFKTVSDTSHNLNWHGFLSLSIIIFKESVDYGCREHQCIEPARHIIASKIV